MGTQGTGRKRSTKKERSTAEDDALNLIAREAEARLAAKRAARAEAREIRMKELERQQKEIFQVQKKYYGLDTKLDDRADGKWGDIEQWMEDSERYSRSSRIQTLSDDDERMSVGSRGSVRSDLDAVGAYGGGDSSSLKKSKKKKKHKHKDKDRNGYDDDYSVISSRSSRLSDESRVSRSSRLDLTSSRLSEDPRGSRASRLDLQPASYASSDLYSFNGLSSSRNPGSTFNGFQSSLYEDSLCSGSRRVTSSSSIPLEYTSYRSSGSRASSRASSARASPVDNCGSVASFLRSTASSSGLPRDLDDVTIPDFSDVSRFAPAGGRGCDVEDRDYLEKGSRAASALTAATLTSLGGTSSRRGSGETALTVDAETSIREIKEIHELKDQIQDVETKYTQNLKEVKDALVEVEEKYRKAMVSNAQLDNEKNNLMYQVDTLKDSLMELEELLAESRRGFEEKVKEYEREKHAHTVLQFQFNEMKETLKQSEELLNEIRQLRIKQEGFVREISDLQETVEWKDKKIGALERQKEYTDAIRIERDELREEVVKLKDILKKHGIVLGPDLNINGEAAEAPVDGLPSADSASTPAKDSPASPPEGNSMLGNTEERLGSSGEEEVNPEQHQEMYTGAKDNHLNSDTLSNVAGASTLETFSQEQPTEEQQTCLEDKKTATEEDNVEEQGLSNDFSVDINVQSLTEAKDIIVCSPGLQNIVISSENAPETETPEGGDVGETVKPDSGDTETKSSSVNIQSNDTRESCSNLSEKQENEQEDEESNLRNTESCLQQKVARDVVRESSPDESFPTSSSAEPQQEPDKAGEAENDETEEISSKSQPQGTAASGKKKKRKKRGKKKGGAQEDKNQQKDETDKEKGKTEIDTESATKDDGPTTEPFDGSVTATLKELKVEQVKKEKVSQETEEVDGIEAVKPTETFSPNETVKESRMDHDTDEQDKEQLLETKNVEKSETFSFSETPKELSADHGMDEHNKDQTLEMENAEKAETVTKTETFSHIETPKEVSMDHVTDEQNKEQSLETETVEAAEAVEAGEAAAHTETLSEVETLTESRTTPRKDEQDKEKTLETEKVEEVESRTSPIPETSFGTPDLIDNSKGAESTDGSEEECTSSVDNSKSETDISTNVIHSESENCLIVSAEEEVGSINDAENSFETSHKENTEAESHVPSNGDIAAAESEYTNNSDIKDNKSISQSSPDGFTDVLKSLSGSEPSSDLFEAVNLNSDDTLVKFSNEGPKKATETVRDGEDPGAEAKQDSLSPSILSPKPDGDESKLKADETEKELKRGTSEPEGLVETESSHDVKSVSCDNASLMKKSDPFDFVQSLLQTEVQATHLDDAEGQTLRHEDQMPESNAVSKVSSETKEDIDMLNTPNSPKETSEIRPAVKHDHSAEDPEPNSSKNEQQSQTKQLHESSIDKSDYNDSSQLTLQDSEEEDIDEGLSFDFDDMDIEAAVAASLPENQNQEEVEEGVEVMSVESNSGSSGLCQSNTESSENRQHEPVESNEEKHEDAGGTPVDKLDTTSRDNQNSSAHEDALSDKNEHAENMSEKQKQMPEEEVSVAEEPEHIIEEGKVLNVGELAVVAEDVNQVISVPAEEGLDAVMHDLQGEHLDLPKSAEQVASNKEPQQTEKDVKKNGKKGKGKGKEECKMS
ncbi:uro-adherence factor A isoform X4 [Plectropomus leopardus]|uniref:uro-adherence factor A isoform X4 n=1 Tax=Plectropomus leopardus TaxID=160734 RepID=UPI001C4D284F|nr:uro-adherence factor A isoform X4 [Plectropomus leopardus]